MNKKIIYSLIGLALIFFVTSLFIFLKSGKESKKNQPVPLKDNTHQETLEPSVMKVKAFFFVEASRFMRPVEYELELSGTKKEDYRKFIELLLKGEENYITPIPEGVELRTIYLVEKQNMVVVDFTEELIHNFPSGTASELEFIYFIVNNICYNFKEIEKVKFLIDGNEYQTLSGHIDMEHPFYPNFRYLREE
ncbi:MAG: GerMN domain-containing protein [Candidatus Aminicenantes bacterium]|nr:MAG: GerMN domain-containing protein [Candidatus Aminicenantes bacterium]